MERRLIKRIGKAVNGRVSKLCAHREAVEVDSVDEDEFSCARPFQHGFHLHVPKRNLNFPCMSG
jgi:hypothetical protein